MKLVDILARELKVWPEGTLYAWQSEFNSEVYFEGALAGTFHASENADDSGTEGAEVTRAQWQDAVDALKADEVSYSAENVSVNANYVAHTNSPLNSECKIVQPEWNGDGLPPAGSYLEVHDQENWEGKRVKVIHNFENQIGDDMVVVESDEDASCACFSIFSLRPTRTPEQIAAEERMNSAKVFHSLVCPEGKWHKLDDVARESWATIYDAGFRKFEIVDN